MRPGGSPRREREPVPAARRTWWVTFTLMAALFGLWSMASPLWSVPDEAAHAVNAAAVVRGQVGGQDTIVEAPEYYAHTDGRYPPCYAFHPEQTADCVPEVQTSDRPAYAHTQFERYPPVPYALLGLPSLLSASDFAVYLMRLVNVVACAALIASGLASARSLGRGMTVAGTLFAVTPMAAYLAGSVNTSGVEIAASIALWPSLLALVRDGPGAPGRLIVRTAVAASALVTARPVSPMWLALILAVVGVVAGWTRLRDLAGDRRVVQAGAVVGGVTALSVLWVVVRHSLAGIASVGPKGQGLKSDLITSAERFPSLFREMIGTLGWLDTPAPWQLVVIWTTTLVGLFLYAVLTGPRPGSLAPVVAAGLVIAVPLVLEVARAKTAGFPWQGRYTLPLAVGVPILAGWLIDTGAGSPVVFVRRAARWVIVVACGAQLVIHFGSTRRYATGTDGALIYFIDPAWNPPVPAWLLLVTFTAVVIALGVWVDRLDTGTPGVGSNPPVLVPSTTPTALAGQDGGRGGKSDA